MLRSILVGLDGSPNSRSAVDLGIGWAQKFDATLVGLGVIDEPTIRKPEPAPIGGGSFKKHRDEALVADARQKVEQFLEDFALRCSAAGVAYKVLRDVGLPDEQISLESQCYDILLLGKQTYFQFETHRGPDDMLTTLLKDSPRPIVTVPEQLGRGDSIVVAYDGSLQAARTLQAFQSLRLGKDREVHVVSVAGDYEKAVCRA